ncbi:MAG: hypothetical protein AAF721_14870 [Myxococcota bacterium]
MEQGENYGSSSEASVGLIGEEGVYLTGATRWLPALSDIASISFEVEVVLPQGWHSLSRGRRTRCDTRATDGGARARPPPRSD